MIEPHCWIIRYVRSAVFQDLFMRPENGFMPGSPHSDKTLAWWLVPPLAGAVSLYEPSGETAVVSLPSLAWPATTEKARELVIGIAGRERRSSKPVWVLPAKLFGNQLVLEPACFCGTLCHGAVTADADRGSGHVCPPNSYPANHYRMP